MQFPATSATVETLPNGLTLVLDPDPSLPLVSVHAWIATGSIHEGQLLGTGLSHFLEHMVFKGTRSFSGDDLATTVQAAGGQWNAYTSFDRTVYHIDGPAAGLETFLQVLAEMVFFPSLPEEEFDREKDVIRREIDMGLDDPGQAATRLLLQTAFTRDARRQPVIGHRHLFDSIRHQDLLAYQRNRYTPDNVHFVITGDFAPHTARTHLENLTAEAKMLGGAPPLPPVDPPQLAPRRGHATFAVPTSRITLAWRIPPLDHPDTPAFHVLANLLGEGRSSRLYRKLREQQELAIEIDAWCWGLAERPGLFAVSAETDPENRDALIAAILAEVAAVPSTITGDEIEKARRQILTRQFHTLTTVSGRAHDLGSNWLEARDLDFTRRYSTAIAAAGADEIRRAAASLTENLRVTAILDPLGTPPPATSSRTASRRPEHEELTLDNGLRVLLLPDPRVPLFAVHAAGPGGRAAEQAATTGLSQLLAAALPKGTDSRSDVEIADTLDSLGASLGAEAGNNTFAAGASGLSRDLPAVLELFAEILAQANFPDAAVAREKHSQLAALLEAAEDPLQSALRIARAACHGPAGYGADLLGSPASLANIDSAQLLAARGRHLNAANLTVAIAGDFRPQDLRGVLADTLGRLPTGDRWSAPPTNPSFGQSVSSHLDKKQSAIVALFPGPAVDDPAGPAATLLREYAADMAGPLFTRIREQLGLAYLVGAFHLQGFHTGNFGFYLATDPAQAALAEAELLAEIAKIASHGIPDQSFERARSSLLAALALGLQSPAALARTAAVDTAVGLGSDHRQRLPTLIQALTPADVRELAARYLTANPVIARVGPPTDSITPPAASSPATSRQ